MTSKGSAQNRLEKLRQQLKMTRFAVQPVRAAKSPKLSPKNDSTNDVSPTKGSYSSSKLATRLLLHKKLTPLKRAILRPKKIGDAPAESGSSSCSSGNTDRLPSDSGLSRVKSGPGNVGANSRLVQTPNRATLRPKTTGVAPTERVPCGRNAPSSGNTDRSLSDSGPSTVSSRDTGNVSGIMRLSQTYNPDKSKLKEKSSVSELPIKAINTRKAIVPSSVYLVTSAPKNATKEDACFHQALLSESDKRKNISDRLRIRKNISKNVDSKRNCQSPIKKVDSEHVPQAQCVTLDTTDRLPVLHGSESLAKRQKADTNKKPVIKSPVRRTNEDAKQNNKEIPFAVKKNLYKRKKCDENSLVNILGTFLNKQQDVDKNIFSNRAKSIKMATSMDKKTPHGYRSCSERAILEARGKTNDSLLVIPGSGVEKCWQNRRNFGSPTAFEESTPKFANDDERLFSPIQTSPYDTNSQTADSSVPRVDPLTHDNKPENLEYMEWEEIPHHKILRSVRNEVDPSEELMDWQEIPLAETSQPAEKSFYFVVDTNVLISNLELIRKITQSLIRGMLPMLLIPWQVLKELDRLKSSHRSEISVSSRARRASHYLLSRMGATAEGRSDSINYQPQKKHFEHCPEMVVEVPDDHLIKCCFQLRNKGPSVILLTNDVNLQVKANASGILSVTDEWVASLLIKNNSSGEKMLYEIRPVVLCSISKYMMHLSKLFLNFLAELIEALLKKKYGDLWKLWGPNQTSNLSDLFKCILSSSLFENFKEEFRIIVHFYEKQKPYDKLTAEEVDKIGRGMYNFSKYFKSAQQKLVTEFHEDIAFLKIPEDEDITRISYSEASCGLTMLKFCKLESSIRTYGGWLTLNWEDIIRKLSVGSNGEVFSIANMNNCINILSSLRNSFQKLERVDKVCTNSEGINEIYYILTQCEADVDNKTGLFPVFTLEDVVEFVIVKREIIFPNTPTWLIEMETFFRDRKYKFLQVHPF